MAALEVPEDAGESYNAWEDRIAEQEREAEQTDRMVSGEEGVNYDCPSHGNKTTIHDLKWHLKQ